MLECVGFVCGFAGLVGRVDFGCCGVLMRFVLVGMFGCWLISKSVFCVWVVWVRVCGWLFWFGCAFLRVVII